ncbi:MAG: hypothetical protein Q8920_14760 [Bacillota bacterium]|nr:hypothetical protein [Bacillota bacterium]
MELLNVVLSFAKVILQAFDIYILVLLETMKIISHADTSSGGVTDVVNGCLSELGKLCKTAAEANYKHFFDTIIKTSRNKVFTEWPEEGYRLLKSAVYFVSNEKQAQKAYEIFPVLAGIKRKLRK